ncbi:MAG: alpha/beta hydrolase [PS1 clade bacterium]|uniref:Alpha/beta hydrolase n=1 Tax=PS1 clade bacterium TaxID=2175152 RepID=A0A368E1Q0_9PROT|nr:MAG: alpha/beta hydrolase [PS1 clade bacterium]
MKKYIFKILGFFTAGLFTLLVIGLFISGFFVVSDLPRSEVADKYSNQNSMFITLENGSTVHIRDEGSRDGEVLVLMHGFGMSLHVWEKWIAELGDTYRLISFDWPGHGLSTPVRDANYNLNALTDYLADVLDWMNIDEFVLVGHSMGGGVAMNYILDNPDKVQALVLIGASGLKIDRSDKPLRMLEMTKYPGMSTALRYITPYDTIKNALITRYGSEAFVSKELVDKYYELMLNSTNREIFIKRLKQMLLDEPLDARIGRLNHPTLLIWGEEDQMVGLKYAKRLRSIILSARLVSYQGVGHMPMEVLPKVTARDLTNFLNSEVFQ